MSNIIREAVALRRKHHAPPGEHLLLDVLLENDFSDDIIFADAMTNGIGGFHTTGYGGFCILLIATNCRDESPDINMTFHHWLKPEDSNLYYKLA